MTGGGSFTKGRAAFRPIEELPEVFDHHDVSRALTYDLERGAARRNLQMLIEDCVLAAEPSESGRFRLRYRKLCGKIPDDAE